MSFGYSLGRSNDLIVKELCVDNDRTFYTIKRGTVMIDPLKKTFPKSDSPPFSLGIDIGGTFSDLVIYDIRTQTLYPHKELTTYDDPARGVLEGIDKLLSKHEMKASDIGRVVHATTLFTNALLERNGAKTGLITTSGFRDVLEIGREKRYELYDLNIRRPVPLVPRHLRREVKERITSDGAIHTAIDLDQVLTEAQFLCDSGVTSIAICFLHSYKNRQHESDAARIIRSAFPDINITCSYEVAPVVREYERVSTAVANAYIKPMAAEYLDVLTTGLHVRGVKSGMLMMASNGGLTSIEDVKAHPIKLLESGPAAGVISATVSSEQENIKRILAFDMGGTTAKLCVVNNGKPTISHMFEAARQKRFMKGSGLPILTPSIELIEIGAGGGSIAKKGVMGLLKVGPESAGSTPGPAAYGRGGTEPTVTDANLALGYLDAENFAGGTMRISSPSAQKAIQELASHCDLDATRTAWGIFDLVNETMSSAASVHVAESGGDPRQFVLVATGGGGPLHAYFIARKLGIKQIVCPAGSGVASAIGLLRAPAVSESVRSIMSSLAVIDWSELESSFQSIESEARQLLRSSAHGAIAKAKVRRFCDCRFSGQSLELSVALPSGPYGSDSKSLFEKLFIERYQEMFSRSPLRSDIELVNIRATMTVEMEAVVSSQIFSEGHSDGATQKAGMRQVYFPESGGFVETPVFQRLLIKPGCTVEGPAVIQEAMSTIVMGPGAVAKMGENGNIVMTLN